MSFPTEPGADPGADPPPLQFNGRPAAPPHASGEVLSVGQAFLLGAMHGPAELLPISSSGHVAVVPWLLRWDYADADPELRKAFEVVLHAGTAAALLITLRPEVQETIRGISPRLVANIGLSSAPAALIGFVLERPIERHLGTPATIAVGLIAGSLAMAWADRCAQARDSLDAGTLDALLLGVAQACALMPGVSRNGSTLAAARLRRFNRQDANKLSRHVALPVIGGATFLKTARLVRRGLPPRSTVPFAVGAAASFLSTLGFTWVFRQVERDRSLAPYAAYRLALAALILRRLRTGD